MKTITPELVEFYEEYTPPMNVRRTIKRALRMVPAADLTGLENVYLTSSNTLSREERRAKVRRGGRKVGMDKALGFYRPATPRGLASITLYVDRILGDSPQSYMSVYDLTRTLYHEVGHHVQEIRRDPRRQAEAFADEYAEKLVWKFMAKPIVLIRLAGPLISKVLRHPVAYIMAYVRTWRQLTQESKSAASEKRRKGSSTSRPNSSKHRV